MNANAIYNSYTHVGKYAISDFCLQSYPCQHVVIDTTTNTRSSMTGVELYKRLKAEGLSYPHVEKYETYDESAKVLMQRLLSSTAVANRAANTKTNDTDADATERNDAPQTTSQLFGAKEPPPLELVYDLLKRVCVVQGNNYVFDINAFKRGLLLGAYGDFMAACCPYYLPSKQYYCKRIYAYNNITTVFRQICNAHGSAFTTAPDYKNKKDYTITYLFPV